ncbi:MAG: T9SS type A sorting domain-containing protein [Saprospiraceae bacterium]|nr:T9SS type A sorting domain-containing protein [Saprospiraceae bacterium]
MTKHFIFLPLISFFCWITLNVQGQTTVLALETLNGPTRSANAAVFAHDANGKVFINYNYKIYTSSNNGVTWQTCMDGIDSLRSSFTAATSPDGTIYTFNNYKLYLYDAVNNIWINKSLPINVDKVAITTDTMNRLWAVRNYSFDGLLYYSEDQGDTWTTIDIGSQPSGYFTFLGTLNDESNYLLTTTGLKKFKITGESTQILMSTGSYSNLALNKFTGSLFHVNSSSIYRLRESDNTWETVYTGSTPINNILSVSVLDSNKMWIHGDKRTVFTQNNGETWTDAPVFSQYAGRYHRVNDSIWFQYGASNAAFNYTTNSGQTWTDVIADIFLPTATDILTDQAGNIYAKTLWKNSYERSTDGGQNWELFYIHPTSNSQLSIKALKMNNNGVLVAIAENNVVFRSIDNGATWTQVFNFEQAFPTATNFEIFSGPSHVLYLYASVGSTGKFYRSNDNGKTWTIVITQFLSNSTLMFLSSVNSEGNLFFAQTDHSIYLYNKNQNTVNLIFSGTSFDTYDYITCTNNGNMYMIFQHFPPSPGLYRTIYKFSPDNGGYTSSTIYTAGWPIQLKPDEESNVYVLHSAGLSKIDSNGVVQTPMYTIPGGSIESIKGFHVSKDKHLFFGRIRHLIERSTSALVSTHPTPSTPYQINAYPNPFDQTINFEVNGENLPEHYTIRIFDMLGKCVKQQDFTGKSCTLNSLKLTPGIYFYHISAEGKNIGAGKIQAE